MGPRVVDAGHKQTYTVRSVGVVLGVGLGAVADLLDDAFDGDGAAVGHFGGERLAFHEVCEDAGVGGEAGEGDAEVVIDVDDFLLVGGEVFCISLRRVSFKSLIS